MNLRGAAYASDCKETAKVIVSRDRRNHKLEHRAENPAGKSVFHILLDGNVFPRGVESACDFLLLCDAEEHIAYFIECKGGHITKALRQLDATAEKLQASLPGYTFCFRVVFSGSSHGVEPQSKVDHLHKKWPRNSPTTEFFAMKTHKLVETI
jgi:hypothetical protein